MDEDPSLIRNAIVKGLAAARHNARPAIALWVFGVVIILGYFRVPSCQAWFDSIAEFKTDLGWVFAAVSTSFFAGLIPVTIPWVFGKRPQKHNWTYLVTNLFFWAYKGIEVDLFYILQSHWFGNQSDIQTIAAKVAVDQIIYAPCLGLLTVVLFYLWRDHHFSFEQFKKNLGKHWYQKRILPVLISNWFVWIPACILVYCLPLGLQLPIQNLILCFWVLILAFFTEQQTASAEPQPNQS